MLWGPTFVSEGTQGRVSLSLPKALLNTRILDRESLELSWLYHRVHTEWQWPISGVHPVMMEKSALAGEVHAHPLSLYLPSCTKLQCTLQLRGQIHSPYFISTHICTLWITLPAMSHFYKRLHKYRKQMNFLPRKVKKILYNGVSRIF